MSSSRKLQRQLECPVWLRPLGAVLLIWFIANTAIDIKRYGLDWGMYWWFCNLALFGMGLALVIKSRTTALGIVSIAIFTQSLWLVDNLAQLFTKQNLFGLVHYLYQPGLPMDEFLLSHYHYFTITVAFLALCYLPRQRISPYPLIAFINPFIFAISYFVFPAYQNVNCIHEPCFGSLKHWGGPLYAITFWAVVFIIHQGLTYLLDRLFNADSWSPGFRRFFAASMKLALLAGVVLTAWDTSYKLSLPKLECLNHEDSGISVACRNTRYHSPTQLLLNYRVHNSNADSAACSSTIILNGEEKPLNELIPIKAEGKVDLGTLIPYPTSDTVVTFGTNCDRQPAGK